MKNKHVVVFVAAFLLAGCDIQPGDSTADHGRLEELERQNKELRDQLASTSKVDVDSVKLINDITDKLAEMGGKEAEVRKLKGDLDPNSWAASIDLRQQIFSQINSLQSSLDESRKFAGQTVGKLNAASVEQQKLVANFQRLLEEKQGAIDDLKAEMESLANRAAELEEEVRQGNEENADLRKESNDKDAKIRAQGKAIEELEREVKSSYYLVGFPDQIDAAKRRNEIFRHLFTYKVKPEVLVGDQPSGFSTIDPTLNEIPLGSHLNGAKILSEHKRYEGLYYMARSGDQWVLRLKDPWAFWRVSRYLIVEVH
jgi:predicted  nucleic acid-binding Zn-ribbon protein